MAHSKKQGSKTKEQVIEMLETVFDPELGVDIWTMGLVYTIDIKSDTVVDILLTYTTPMCPSGEQIKEDIEASLKMLGFETVNITVTFDPPWKPSDELRVVLGV
jgi:metal-sulfur cluster biosynthetic enzyme